MRKTLWPYLLAVLLGVAAGASAEHLVGARRLADEHAARASEAQQHADVRRSKQRTKP